MSSPFDYSSTDSHAATIYYPDENRLRKIVREELAAQLGALSEASAQKDSAAVLEPEDEAKYQYQRELVAQQLEYHTSVGSISDTDMQKLQGEIAKLDEAGRKEMLSKLIPMSRDCPGSVAIVSFSSIRSGNRLRLRMI